jgi:hypothetical protein
MENTLETRWIRESQLRVYAEEAKMSLMEYMATSNFNYYLSKELSTENDKCYVVTLKHKQI